MISISIIWDRIIKLNIKVRQFKLQTVWPKCLKSFCKHDIKFKKNVYSRRLTFCKPTNIFTNHENES